MNFEFKKKRLAENSALAHIIAAQSRRTRCSNRKLHGQLELSAPRHQLRLYEGVVVPWRHRLSPPPDDTFSYILQINRAASTSILNLERTLQNTRLQIPSHCWRLQDTEREALNNAAALSSPLTQSFQEPIGFVSASWVPRHLAFQVADDPPQHQPVEKRGQQNYIPPFSWGFQAFQIALRTDNFEGDRPSTDGEPISTAREPGISHYLGEVSGSVYFRSR